MKILEKELFIISKIIFIKDLPVFVLDPGNLVLKNFSSGFAYIKKRSEVEQLAKFNKPFYLLNISGANTFSFPLNFSNIEAIISFSPNSETSINFYHKDLYFFTDEYNRIKWFVSENHTITDFLHDLDENKSLTDVSNFLSVFPFTWKYLMLKIGNIKKIAKGRIQLLIRDRYLFKTIDHLNFDSYSVNLSDCSEGNLMFRFYKNKKSYFIIKKPYSNEGKKKLDNEIQNIEWLQQFSFSFFKIPKLKSINNEYLLEFDNPFIKSDHYKLQKKWNDLFNNSLLELASKTFSETKLSRIWRNENLQDNLIFIKARIDKKMFPNGLSILNFVKIYSNLLIFYDTIEPDEIIYSTFCIKDLHPSFSGSNNKEMLFHNFESAEKAYPLLYDFFLFSFEHTQSFEFPETSDLIKELDFIEELISDFQPVKLDKNYFTKLLKIFMLIYATPQLASLLVKPVIPPEENLKLVLWAELIDYMNGIKNEQEK